MPERAIDIDKLAERILLGDLPRLGAAELDAVLSWVSGSERLGAGELIRLVATPRERPDLMRQVYHHLDRELFHDGKLNLVIAHVHPGIDTGERRARYRRLMTAFHPDRYPDNADWMTPRSQAIHKAWRQFRRGEVDDCSATQEARQESASASRRKPRQPWRSERKSARLTPERPDLPSRIRRRLGAIDNLQAKLLVGLAVLAFVPVAWMYLAYQPWRSDPGSETVVVGEGDPGFLLRPGADDSVVSGRGGSVDLEPDDGVVLRRDEPGMVAGAETLPGRLEVWERDWARADVPVAADAPDSVPPGPNVTAAASEATEPAMATVPEYMLPQAEETPADSTGPPEPAEAERTEAVVAAAPEDPEPAVAVAAPDPAAVAETSETAHEAAEPRPLEPETDTAVAHLVPEAVQPDPAEPRSAEPDASDRLVEQATEPADPPPMEIATIEPVVAEPPRPSSRELIGELLDGYRRSFERGQLDEFLAHFTASPRENRNQGRQWFHDNYDWLFTESLSRELSLDIISIEGENGQWQVTARFELNVDWPDRRPVRDRRTVRYTVRDHDDGRLRIAAIDY